MAFKIAAKDQDDLTVLSALLQDSIVERADIAFLAGEKRFVMIASRFRWEEQAGEEQPVVNNPDEDASYLDDEVDSAHFSRVKSALRIENVSAVQTKNFEQGSASANPLNVLSLEQEGNDLIITLSNAAAIKISTAKLACYLEDVGDPWPSPSKPNHDL
jgi:hypothetical protein